MFFDRGNPHFWNFNSTIPVDIVGVKTYVNRRIFADVIVYIFCSLAYNLPNRSSGRIYELNTKVERAD